MLNYDTLIELLNDYLTKQYLGISTRTDIFEHAFLRFLGYQFVPEKCQFKDNQRNNSLSIYLRTPYNLASRDVIDDLLICATGKFSDISVEEIYPNINANQGRYCVLLSVSYRLIETYISEILQSISTILADPLKIGFYRYCDIHTKKFEVGLTITFIENLFREKLLQYPHVNFEDVWNAIIQINNGKETKVKFLEKKIWNDVNNFPKITLIYEENGERNEIVLTRDQVVIMLEKTTLDKLLIGDSTSQEFIIPPGIKQFIKDEYHRSFFISDEGHCEIDLGYHSLERKALEKYGIKELSSYRPSGAIPERTQIYVYDKENYRRALLALKEIKGAKCFDERWHQLTYYIHHQMWEKLDKELIFLLNLKTATGVEIDYTKLLIGLYQHAKDNLREELQEKTIEIIEKVCKHLVGKILVQSNVKKEIYNILYELTLIRMNQLGGNDECERVCLKKELFIYSQKIGLEESNHYLGEIAGLGFGNTFPSNVNENPLAVLIDIAEKHKIVVEENARLKSEISKLKVKNSLPGDTTNPNNTKKESYFTLRK